MSGQGDGMPNPHRIEIGRASQAADSNRRLHHPRLGFSLGHRRPETARQEKKNGSKHEPVSKKARRPDWDMVGIWLFLVCLIIISLLVAYQLWAKLCFRSP